MTAKNSIFALLCGFFLLAGCTPSAPNDSFQRDESKPIIFEEFSDFECPFCKQIHPVIDKLHNDFPHVQFRYAYLPLEQIHKHAFRAAEAAECVRQNESSTVFHKTLTAFYNTSNLQDDGLKTAAVASGANEAKLNECLTSGKAQKRVRNDMKEAAQRGITSTPSLFINGKKYEGERSYEKMYQALKNAQ